MFVAYTEAEIARGRKLVKAGMSRPAMARKMGIAATTAYRWCAGMRGVKVVKRGKARSTKRSRRSKH